MVPFSAHTEDTLAVDDVFSTDLYTGNASTQAINNGIDLAGAGGLVWMKSRSAGGVGYSHCLFDTVRGRRKLLCTSSTGGNEGFGSDQITFGAGGFTLAADASNYGYNRAGSAQVAWSFRRAPKFFDVVEFTTSASAVTNQRVGHSLGITPGMIILKATGATSSWPTWHRSLTDQTGYYLMLNGAGAQSNYSNCFGTTGPTSTDFGVNTNFFGTNQQMVAFVFGHDTSSGGIIQCGAYTGNGSTSGPTITLGCEQQFVMVKGISSSGGWQMADVTRGMDNSDTKRLLAHDGGAELSGLKAIVPTAGGFQITDANANFNTSGATYAYLAIRKP